MGKPLEIVVLPQVQDQMDDAPDMAEAMREFIANLHQAQHAVETGQHATIEDAIEAITGNRPEPLDFDEYHEVPFQ